MRPSMREPRHTNVTRSLRSANCTLIARRPLWDLGGIDAQLTMMPLTCDFRYGAGDENRTRTISLGN